MLVEVVEVAEVVQVVEERLRRMDPLEALLAETGPMEEGWTCMYWSSRIAQCGYQGCNFELVPPVEARTRLVLHRHIENSAPN